MSIQSNPDNDQVVSGSIFRSEQPLDTDEATISVRSVLAGILIGIMVCFANLYFALQTALVNSMTLPSALIGFAFFKSTSKYWTKPFTPMENVLVQRYPLLLEVCQSLRDILK
jgi:uncharacterized oligopeptide transporter (OPT) family protein